MKTRLFSLLMREMVKFAGRAKRGGEPVLQLSVL
jgi:hypothetical protein